MVEGGSFIAVGDLGVVADPLHPVSTCDPVVEAARTVDVVVLQVDERHSRMAEVQVVPLPVRLDQLVLGHPVALAVRGSTGRTRGPSDSAPTCREPGPPEVTGRASP